MFSLASPPFGLEPDHDGGNDAILGVDQVRLPPGGRVRNRNVGVSAGVARGSADSSVTVVVRRVGLPVHELDKELGVVVGHVLEGGREVGSVERTARTEVEAGAQ